MIKALSKTDISSPLHTLKVKAHAGDPYMDIFLDGKQVGGVTEFTVNAKSREIPTVTFTMLLLDADISVKEAIEEVTT